MASTCRLMLTLCRLCFPTLMRKYRLNKGIHFISNLINKRPHLFWVRAELSCVCLCVTAYLSELPDDTGGFELHITWAVPHTDGGLSFEYFSAQLRHRVETDLLPWCVFKVLEHKRVAVICPVFTARMFGLPTLPWNEADFRQKSNWKSTEIKILLCLGCVLLLP